VVVRFSIGWFYIEAMGCLYIPYRGYFWMKLGVKTDEPYAGEF